MASEMVMAYGDHGLEPTPATEVVEIAAIPAGAGNLVIPSTIRWLAQRGGHIPTRLLRVEKPNKRNRAKHVYVTFQCTPFPRYELESGPVYGDWSGCSVRIAADVNDPLFLGLTDRERARIASAVHATARADREER